MGAKRIKKKFHPAEEPSLVLYATLSESRNSSINLDRNIAHRAERSFLVVAPDIRWPRRQLTQN